MKPRFAMLTGLAFAAVTLGLPRAFGQDTDSPPNQAPAGDQAVVNAQPDGKDQAATEAKDRFTVTVQGEVTRPGHYTISSDYTVIDVIEMAGGFTPKSLRSKVMVQRHIPGSNEVGSATLDYSDETLNPANAEFKLKQGDVISIPVDPTYGK